MKTTIQRSEFGEKLRKKRMSKGLTQTQLAELSGISSRMIAHYECHVKMPPLNKVKILAEALGISSDELIGTTKKTKEQIKQEDVSHKIMKKVRVIEKLPVRDQKAIFRLINSLTEKNNIKKG